MDIKKSRIKKGLIFLAIAAVFYAIYGGTISQLPEDGASYTIFFIPTVFLIIAIVYLVLAFRPTYVTVKKKRQYPNAWKILGGIAIIIIGSGLTWLLIKGDIGGFVTLGFIPVPMIVIVPLVPFGGLCLLIYGIVSVFRK